MKKTLAISTIIGMLMLSLFLMFTPPTAKAQEIVWKTNPTPLPTPTHKHMSIAYNGRLYLIGTCGGGGEESPNVYFAGINPDGTVGSWQETTPLPEWRELASAVVWNNFVYVIGGAGPVWEGRAEQNSVFYTSINPDDTIGNWMSATLLPERITAHAATVCNGRIYVAGGWNGYSRQDEVYYAQIDEIDGSIGSWQTTTPLPRPLNRMCALAYEDVMYIIGGCYAREPQTSVYYAFIDEADGTLGEWTTTSSLPEPRASVRGVLVGNGIYVVGGHGGTEFVDEAPENTVYRATIRPEGLGNWEELQSIPEARREHSLVTFNGRIYVLGGLDIELNPRETIYYSSSPTVSATVDIKPDTLNLKSKGEWITAYIELPEGYNVADINVSSIKLNDTVPAELRPTAIGDYDNDTVPDLMVKFDRAEVIEYILDQIPIVGRFMTVTLTITGKLNDGTPFHGSDTIKIIYVMTRSERLLQ